MEDGALALDPAELWQEPAPSPSSADETSAIVPRMSSPRARHAARVRARRQRREHHAGRLLLLAVLSTGLLVVLLLSAFGSGSPQRVATAPASASRLLPAGRPSPQIVAAAGMLQLQLPIAQSALTAVGYHVGGPSSLELTPVGRQGNEGLFSRLWHRVVGGGAGTLVWYQLGGEAGPGTSALDVGAAAGTDVYAPVDGTVVGISDYVVSNRTYGARIDIRPLTAPSFVVSVTQLQPDPGLVVGSSVTVGTSKIGTLVDLTGVERQALARFTQDAGNNVTLEVSPSASLDVP